MAMVKPVDVEFAELWLADLQVRLEGKTGEAPQQLALSQFFTLNHAYRHWTKNNAGAGKFQHVVAVLAVDRQVPFTRTTGLAATFIGLGMPGIKSGVGSVWSRLMTAIWTNKIDMLEVQQLGIHEALEAHRELRRAPAFTALPANRSAKALTRGNPLTWATIK